MARTCRLAGGWILNQFESANHSQGVLMHTERSTDQLRSLAELDQRPVWVSCKEGQCERKVQEICWKNAEREC